MITESELAISLSNFVSSLRNFVTYLPAEAGLLHKVTQRILKVSQRKKRNYRNQNSRNFWWCTYCSGTVLF